MDNTYSFANYIDKYSDQLRLEAKPGKIQDENLSKLINNLAHELSIISFFICYRCDPIKLNHRILKASEYCETINLYDGYQATAEKVKNIFASYQKGMDTIPDANKRLQELEALIVAASAQTSAYDSYCSSAFQSGEQA